MTSPTPQELTSLESLAAHWMASALDALEDAAAEKLPRRRRLIERDATCYLRCRSELMKVLASSGTPTSTTPAAPQTLPRPTPQDARSAETAAPSIRRNVTSSSGADAKPMAISTPQSTETKTEADDSGQVAAQTKPAPPRAQTAKGREFRRMTLLNVATVLLMVVLSLTSTQSWMQTNSEPAVAVTILIISIQLLIAIALFL